MLRLMATTAYSACFCSCFCQSTSLLTSPASPHSPPPAGFASARCTCAAERWPWAKHNWEGHGHCRHSIGLSPAVGGTGLQLWRFAAVDGGRLLPGATITLQNSARTSCDGYLAAYAPRCGWERVQLSGDRWSIESRWVLRAGPAPLTFVLEAVGASRCPCRWLGASKHCSSDELGLFPWNDPHTLLVWLILPA